MAQLLYMALLLLLVYPALVIASILADASKKRLLGLISTTTYSLLSILLVPALVAGGLPARINLPLGIGLYADILSTVYVLTSSIIVLVAGIYTYIRYSSISDGRFAKYGVLSLLLYATSLLVLTDNWLVFAVLWETISFIAYYMILSTSRDTGPHYTYYLTMHITGFMILVGAALLYADNAYDMTRSTGETLVVPALLLAAGFVSKAGVFPFHYWVQQVYDNIEPLYSALFSGIVDPLGVYGLYRLASAMRLPENYVWLLVSLSLVSMIISIIWYWGARRLSSMLAWSTIYNMSWMVLALTLPGMGALALLLPLYIMCHGLSKASAFMTMGVYGGDYGRIRRLYPHAGFLLAASILAVEGAPPFNLFIAKIMILRNTFASMGVAAVVPVLAWFVSSLFFFRILASILFPGEGASGEGMGSSPGLLDALIALMVVLNVFAYWIVSCIAGGGAII